MPLRNLHTPNKLSLDSRLLNNFLEPWAFKSTYSKLLQPLFLRLHGRLNSMRVGAIFILLYSSAWHMKVLGLWWLRELSHRITTLVIQPLCFWGLMINSREKSKAQALGACILTKGDSSKSVNVRMWDVSSLKTTALMAWEACISLDWMWKGLRVSSVWASYAQTIIIILSQLNQLT